MSSGTPKIPGAPSNGDKPVKDGKGAWRRLGLSVLAVGLVLAAVFLLPRLVLHIAFSTGNKVGFGELADGTYYYSTKQGVWAYTPESGSERLLRASKYDACLVDGTGVYYTKGLSLYARYHDTGEVKMLYTADKDSYERLALFYLEDGDPVMTLIREGGGENLCLTIDGKTGDILTSEEKNNAGLYKTTYRAGDRVFTIQDYYDLYEDGVSVLPRGAKLDRAEELGCNVLIRYYYSATDERGALLALPDGGFLDVSDCEVLTGTDGWFLYIEAYDGEPYDVYCYDIATGGTWLLRAEMDIYQATTDGTWLYTYVPWWKGRVDCWRLLFDAGGLPAGLELVESGI